MHPLRKLREAGPPTPEQAAAILAENVVMHSPVLIKPIIGRELVAITLSNSFTAGMIRENMSSRASSTREPPCCAGKAPSRATRSKAWNC